MLPNNLQHSFARAMVVLLLLSGGSPYLGSQGVPTPALVAQLLSANWEQRSTAFLLLGEMPGAMTRADVRSTLMEMVRREFAPKRDGGVPWGTVAQIRDAGEAEAYGEYASAILDACALHCPRTQLFPFLLSLASDASEIQTWGVSMLSGLRKHFGMSDRAVIDSALAALALTQRSFITRSVALDQIGRLVSGTDDIAAKGRSLLRAAAIAGTNDRDRVVRIAAVRALGEFRDKRDRARLLEIAERDTMSVRDSRGRVVFPAREAARQALAKIPPVPY